MFPLACNGLKMICIIRVCLKWLIKDEKHMGDVFIHRVSCCPSFTPPTVFKESEKGTSVAVGRRMRREAVR